MRKQCLYIILSCLAGLLPAFAYTPLAIHEALVKIDGHGNEAFWQKAPVLTGFIQSEPVMHAAPSRKTEVKIAYTPDFLYVLAVMTEPDPRQVVRVLTRRDRASDADNIAIDIDSYHDHRSAFHFEVNAGGTLRDGVLDGDAAGVDYSWDAVWDAAVTVGNGGWTAELAIPFSCLRFRGDGADTIGINLRRYVARNRESVALIDMSASETGYVSRFATLENLEGVNTGQAFVQLPYLSLRNPQDGPLSKMTLADVPYAIGLDMAYGWTGGTMLNASLNPDFGQVEADRALIDLSGFETFFPEKRSFFLEGAQIFSTDYRLFYSRRIGRSPTGRAEVPEGGELLEKPENTTILGAAKLTGKTAGGLQFGVIEALTSREDAVVTDSLGRQSTQEVEPRALYQVARFKQDVLTRSSVGIIATGRHYLGRNTSLGTGMDWDMELPHPDYFTSGQIVSSRTADGTWGYGGTATVQKSAGEHITGKISGHYDQPELDLNPAGYFTGMGRKGLSGTITGALRPGNAFRKLNLNASLSRTWNFDDVPLENRLEVTYTTTHDLATVNLGYNHDFEVYDDHSSWYGNLIGILPTREIWSWITPQLGPRADLTIKLEYRPVWQGTNWRRIGGVLTVRPLTRWEVSLDTKYARVNDPQAFVASATDTAGSGVDIAGTMHQETFDLVTKSTFLFTNTLSLQFYNQVFSGITRYQNLRKLTGAFSTVRMEDINYSADPDFRKTVCNTNLTLRWEFKPGSTFYAVWSQSYNTRLQPGEDGLAKALDLISLANVSQSFMLKFDYRFAVNLH